MNSAFYYPLQLSLVGASITGLRMAVARGWSVRRVNGLGAIASVGLAAVGAHISHPRTDLLGDFYQGYYPGSRAALAGPDAMRALLAQHTPETAVLGFVNLPIMGWLFTPFGVLGRPTAGYVYTLLGLLAVLGAWRALVRLGGLDTFHANVLLCLVAADGPLLYSLKEGNTSHLALGLLALALLLVRGERHWGAGALVGLATLLKLPLVVFGLYFLVRRRWRELFGMAAVGTVAVALSLLVFGWEMHVLWYKTYVQPFQANPMPAFNVQSWHGFLQRFEFGAAGLYQWSPTPLDPTARALASLAVFATWLATAWSFASHRNQRSLEPDARRELEWAGVVCLAVLGGPMSWSHYYALMLLPVALVLAGGAHFPASPAVRRTALVGFALTALPVAVPRLSPPWLQEVFVRSLLSHFLFGGLALMATVLFVRRYPRAELGGPA